MLLLSLFSTKGINASAENGLFYGGGVHLVWLQALAVAVVFAYAFILSFIIGKAIDKTIGLRVTAEEEDRGLDISHLVETAYQPPWFETGEDGELGLGRQRHPDQATAGPGSPGQCLLLSYRICTPLIALEMINRWISEVPSKMV
jgi:hypothetical protein